MRVEADGREKVKRGAANHPDCECEQQRRAKKGAKMKKSARKFESG